MGIPNLDAPSVIAIALKGGLALTVARLLEIASLVTPPRASVAVGGGAALPDGGWRRHTDDLDLFARPAAAKRLVRAFRDLGMKTFWITEAHAVAWLDEDNADAIARGESPTVRIDILSTVTEPEASAIRTAVPSKRLGVNLKVFRSDYLAAIKFLAGRPQDLVDFDRLVQAGVDVERVKYIVATADDTRTPALLARIEGARKPFSGLRETGWLDEAALREAWRANGPGAAVASAG